MSKSYISNDLRIEVQKRANDCCEYCLINKKFTFFSHEIDHIISEKHRGETHKNNLCLSCFECNRYKGSDIGSLDIETGEFTRLYNPRRDKWEEHFYLDNVTIHPLTAIGRVTLFLLQINSEEQLARRQTLIQSGHYP